MKKIFAILLCVTMMFSLAACSGQNRESTSPDNSSELAEQSGEPPASETSSETLSGTSGAEYFIDAGTETYRGFVNDNVYHSPNDGDLEVLAADCSPMMKRSWAGCSENRLEEITLSTEKLAQNDYELNHMEMSAVFGGAKIIK